MGVRIRFRPIDDYNGRQLFRKAMVGDIHMGLLSKTNPKATWLSVLRSALAFSSATTVAYAAFLAWHSYFEDWPMKLGICAVLMACVAGVFEWQVPPDNELVDGLERAPGSEAEFSHRVQP